MLVRIVVRYFMICWYARSKSPQCLGKSHLVLAVPVAILELQSGKSPKFVHGFLQAISPGTIR